MLLERYIFLVGFFLTLNNIVLSEFNLTIVHINDFHSHWLEFNDYERVCSDAESAAGNCYGGFPRILTAVQELRKKEQNMLLLSTGEFFYGNSYNHLHGFKLAKHLLPRLGINAMSLSNHDFDVGLYELSAFLYNMEFPILCSNMVAHNMSYMYSRVNKSAILNVKGQKIGVIGYAHPQVLEKSNNIATLKFLKELPEVQKEAKDLRIQGINKIIALGHSGYKTDCEIAKEVEDVDIVIGGSSNIVIEKPNNESGIKVPGNIYENYPRVHHHMKDVATVKHKKKSLILHVPQHGKYLGIVRVTFDDDGNIVDESGEPLLLDKSIPQDPESLLYLKNASRFLENISEEKYQFPVTRDQVLTVATEDLDGNRRNCRTKECSLGNFVTDAMLYTYDKFRYKYGDVDAVVINSGIILHSIQAGNVTLRDLFHALICGDQMIKTYMSGSDLKLMMEISAHNYDQTGVSSSGAFLQISGLKVEYDLNQAKGNRVKRLLIRRRLSKEMKPVEPLDIYFIAMPSFIKTGQDGYPVYNSAEDEAPGELGTSDVMLILGFLKDNPIITPKLDLRISFYEENKSTDLNNFSKSESILHAEKESLFSSTAGAFINESEEKKESFHVVEPKNLSMKVTFDDSQEARHLKESKADHFVSTDTPTISTQNDSTVALPSGQKSVLNTHISTKKHVVQEPPKQSDLSFQTNLSPKAKGDGILLEISGSNYSFSNENYLNNSNILEPKSEINGSTNSVLEKLEELIVLAVIAETIEKTKYLTENALDVLGEQLKIHLLKQTKLKNEYFPKTDLPNVIVTNENVLNTLVPNRNQDGMAATNLLKMAETNSHTSVSNKNSDATTVNSYNQLKNSFQTLTQLPQNDHNDEKYLKEGIKSNSVVTGSSHNDTEPILDKMVKRIVDSALTKVKYNMDAIVSDGYEHIDLKTTFADNSIKDLRDDAETVTEMAERIITQATSKLNKNNAGLVEVSHATMKN